jgi:hypothetical protein
MSKDAEKAYSDLNTFAMIVTILEGGHIYLDDSDVAARTIIKLCKKQQQLCLRSYDAALSRSKVQKPEGNDK